MPLLDSFNGPKWQHKNPKVRIDALADLDDQNVLLELVTKDPDVIIDPVDPIVPFPTDKLSVLIVEETADRIALAKNHPKKLNAITSARLHNLIKDHGGDFALVDPDSDLSKEEAWVTEAMKVKRGKLPWVVVSNGKTGASQEVVDLDSLLKLIEKHK